MLDSRQLGLKLIANVTYGYTSANYSGRMPCIEVTSVLFASCPKHGFPPKNVISTTFVQRLLRRFVVSNTFYVDGNRRLISDLLLQVKLRTAVKAIAFAINFLRIAVIAMNEHVNLTSVEKCYIICHVILDCRQCSEKSKRDIGKSDPSC